MDKSLIQKIKSMIDALEADGCEDCAYEDREECEEPCKRCKRNCKDYWKKGEQE